MSQRALLLAVRDRLCQPPADGGLGYRKGIECEVMFDGQPPVSMPGDFFVAVHPGEWIGRDAEALDELYGVNITVTLRVTKFPQDRIGINALVGDPGQRLDRLLEAIRAKLHKDPGPRSATNSNHYPVLALANAIIGAGDNGFVEPLVFRGADPPQPRGPDWFLADVNVETRLPPIGLSQTMRFGGARRLQVIEEQS